MKVLLLSALTTVSCLAAELEQSPSDTVWWHITEVPALAINSSYTMAERIENKKIELYEKPMITLTETLLAGDRVVSIIPIIDVIHDEDGKFYERAIFAFTIASELQQNKVTQIESHNNLEMRVQFKFNELVDAPDNASDSSLSEDEDPIESIRKMPRCGQYHSHPNGTTDFYKWFRPLIVELDLQIRDTFARHTQQSAGEKIYRLDSHSQRVDATGSLDFVSIFHRPLAEK